MKLLDGSMSMMEAGDLFEMRVLCLAPHDKCASSPLT